MFKYKSKLKSVFGIFFLAIIASIFTSLFSITAYAKSLPKFDDLFSADAMASDNYLEEGGIYDKNIEKLDAFAEDNNTGDLLNFVCSSEVSKSAISYIVTCGGVRTHHEKKFNKIKDEYYSTVESYFRRAYELGKSDSGNTDKAEKYGEKLLDYVNSTGKKLTNTDIEFLSRGISFNNITIPSYMIGYFESIGLKDSGISEKEILENQIFKIQSSDWTVNKVVYSSDTTSFKIALYHAIEKYQSDINFILNTLIGFGVLVAVLIGTINFMKLGTTSGHPMARRHTIINICVSFATVMVLGTSRLLAYIAILMFF